MIKEFESYIISNRLFIPESSKVLMAISGGIDSMVMLHLMCRIKINAAIAHCNFGLRGEESDGDELFVRNSAEKNQLKFFCNKFNTENYAKEKGISIQMAARELRYNWFEELSVEHGFDVIALAQHADDRIETLFINLLRGTGIKGLHSLSAKKGKLIRPLLFSSRAQIESYAVTNKVEYREDSSNVSEKYIRNNIRHNIIPVFRNMQPAFKDVMDRNIDNFAFTNQIFDEFFDLKRNKLLRDNRGIYEIKIRDLEKFVPLDKYLYELIKKFNFTTEVCIEIAYSIKHSSISGKEFFSYTHVLLKDRDKLFVKPLPSGNEKEEYLLDENTQQITISENLKLEIVIRNHDLELEIPSNKNIAFFDKSKLKYPLTIRKWRKGDCFYPLGMKSKKKLSDFFIDNKLTKFEKEKVWILESAGEIVWVLGHRIDNRFKVVDETQKIFCLYAKTLLHKAD